MKKCELKGCAERFEPSPYWQRFHADKCRDAYQYQRKKKAGWFEGRKKSRAKAAK